jgi:hypothetical protein
VQYLKIGVLAKYLLLSSGLLALAQRFLQEKKLQTDFNIFILHSLKKSQQNT